MVERSGSNRRPERRTVLRSQPGRRGLEWSGIWALRLRRRSPYGFASLRRSATGFAAYSPPNAGSPHHRSESIMGISPASEPNATPPRTVAGRVTTSRTMTTPPAPRRQAGVGIGGGRLVAVAVDPPATGRMRGSGVSRAIPVVIPHHPVDHRPVGGRHQPRDL
jgi:hypothetical protein